MLPGVRGVSYHLASIMGAIRRVKSGRPLEEYDKGLIIPLLENCLAEYAGGEIQFRQVGRKFVVDKTEFRNLLGFHYLQAVLTKPGEWVATKTLSPINGEVLFEAVAERGFIRQQINRKVALVKELEWMRRCKRNRQYDPDEDEFHEDAFKIADELLTIESYLSKTTHAGKIKHIHNDYDRNMQTVTKCIRLAIKYLKDHPDTAHIGQHIGENVKTGALCRYTGKFIWKY